MESDTRPQGGASLALPMGPVSVSLLLHLHLEAATCRKRGYPVSKLAVPPHPQEKGI